MKFPDFDNCAVVRMKYLWVKRQAAFTLLINGSGKSIYMYMYMIYMHTSIGVYICMYTHTRREKNANESNKWAKCRLVRKSG